MLFVLLSSQLPFGPAVVALGKVPSAFVDSVALVDTSATGFDAACCWSAASRGEMTRVECNFWSYSGHCSV